MRQVDSKFSEPEEIIDVLTSIPRPICKVDNGAEKSGCAEMGLLSQHAPQRPARVQPASGDMPPTPPPSANTRSLRDQQGEKLLGRQMFGVMATPPPDAQPASHGHDKEAIQIVAGAGLGLGIPPHIRIIRKHNPTYLLEKYPVYP